MSPPAPTTSKNPTQSTLEHRSPSNVDVLIIGAGPAGLMAAACLARVGVHNVRIIDKRATKVFTGQADGLNSRTLEILEALGLGLIRNEANCFGECCFWDPIDNGQIGRTARLPATIPGISRFQYSALHQGRIERVFLDKIAEWSATTDGAQKDCRGPIHVERAVCPDLITLPPLSASALSDSDEDRIVIRLRHLTEAESQPAQFSPLAPDGLFRSNLYEDDAFDAAPKAFPDQETLEEVRCRYVIGTDGARSWTRGAIGLKLEGESTDFFWGVVDGVPVTDFPDVRMRCCIHSAANGSVLIIPRENGIVRFYVQLPQAAKGERPKRSDVTPEKILNLANVILAPYTVCIPKVEWYTCYQVGQRLVDHWSWNNRVFLGGDACHTHSPKRGQGMNMSMADTFNLSWKLAHVLQGKAHPKILETYEDERAPLAAQLIDLDKKVAHLFSTKPEEPGVDGSGISLLDFHRAMAEGARFSSGTVADYASSSIMAKPGSPHQGVKNRPELAINLPVGPRLASHQVVCLSDAKPYQTGDLAPVDGKWRIFIFGGDFVQNLACKQNLDQLAQFLAESESSPIKKYTPPGEDSDSVIECITILSSPRTSLELNQFPDILRPTRGEHGFGSYQKIFTDDETYHHGHGHAYEAYGIDPKAGCVVVVRPDQHVSLITDTADHSGLAGFFDEFMLSPKPLSSSAPVPPFVCIAR